MFPYVGLPARISRRAVLPALILSMSFTACSRSPEPRMPTPSAPVAGAAEEGTPESIVGRRARVREAGPGRSVIESVGIVREVSRDSVRLETEQGRVLPFALGSAARLEISRGMKANTGRGAWIGGLIGGVGLGVAGAAICDGDRSGDFYDPTSSECAIGGALLGGVSGALIGLVVGALTRTERWEEVPPDRTGLTRGGNPEGGTRKAP